MFQTMDNVDGKHARATKSSSALGEYFDHGLDLFSDMIVFLSWAYSMNLDIFETTLVFSIV